jgi:hypothetical protein
MTSLFGGVKTVRRFVPVKFWSVFGQFEDFDVLGNLKILWSFVGFKDFGDCLSLWGI